MLKKFNDKIEKKSKIYKLPIKKNVEAKIEELWEISEELWVKSKKYEEKFIELLLLQNEIEHSLNGLFIPHRKEKKVRNFNFSFKKEEINKEFENYKFDLWKYLDCVLHYLYFNKEMSVRKLLEIFYKYQIFSSSLDFENEKKSLLKKKNEAEERKLELKIQEHINFFFPESNDLKINKLIHRRNFETFKNKIDEYKLMKSWKRKNKELKQILFMFLYSGFFNSHEIQQLNFLIFEFLDLKKKEKDFWILEEKPETNTDFLVDRLLQYFWENRKNWTMMFESFLKLGILMTI